MTNELITLTKKLVAMPTISSDTEENEKALAWIVEYMDIPKKHIKYYKDHKHPSVVFATQSDTKNFDVILHGHIDVVPADPEEFVPTEKDGVIYGRGTTDMKGGLAVLMLIFRQLIAEKTNKNIGFIITSDEELGGEKGTKYLLDKKGYKSKFFLTAEGLPLAHKIITKAKGILLIHLESTGTPAHGARPWLGHNAIELLFAAYQDIAKLFPTIDIKDYWHTTINLSTIQGGEADNSVPKYAKIAIDIRFTEEWESGDKILSTIQKILTKHPHVKISNIINNEAVLNTDENNIYVVKLHDSFKKYVKHSHGLGFAHATSDARIAAWKGIPAVEFGPKGLYTHSHQESVAIAEMEKFYFVMQDFVQKL